MKYGADDLINVSWDKIAADHLATAQDIFADYYSRRGSVKPASRDDIALAQAHSLQALALLYGWSR